MRKTDDIIIGGGPGGYEVAAELAASGRKVVLIERDRLGGTCLNRGCIPTKCLCATAERALEARRAAEFGVDIDGVVTVDYSRATGRMRSVVEQLREGVQGMLCGVECISGEAKITADGYVEANGELLEAERVLIATGSRPARLSIEGAELAVTSDDILQEMDSLPKKIVIIGGGVIGIEFASIYNAMGAEVTVVEYCKEILPQFDPDIAKRLRLALQSRGVKFATGASVERIAPGMSVHYKGKRGEDMAEGDMVLMATGRRPVLPGGLAEAGIATDSRGFIVVDEDMRTSREGFYAAGDVTGLCMLAHAASAQARIAMKLGERADMAVVPSAVFSIPEAAMAGLTAAACADRGIECATARTNYASNGKALAEGVAQTGLLKIVYSPADRRILGVHALGAHASDLVAEASALMCCGATVDMLADRIVHCHPTLSELLPAAARTVRQQI